MYQIILLENVVVVVLNASLLLKYSLTIDKNYNTFKENILQGMFNTFSAVGGFAQLRKEPKYSELRGFLYILHQCIQYILQNLYDES